MSWAKQSAFRKRHNRVIFTGIIDLYLVLQRQMSTEGGKGWGLALHPP